MSRTRSYPLFLPLAFIALALCCFDAFAQSDQITVEAEISRSRVYVGDELTYQVIVRGVVNPSVPEVVFPASVKAVLRGRSSQVFSTMRVVNGRNRSVTDRRFNFQYALTAVSEGDISIPPPTLTVDNIEYSGNRVSFESLLPIQSKTDFLDVSIKRNELYTNETMIVDCTWWIGAQTTEFSFASSYFPQSFEFHGHELQAAGAQRIGFEVNGHKLVGVLLTGVHNGVEMKKLDFRFSITPTQAGSFRMGPIRVVFTRHSAAGSSFRSYAETESIMIRTLDIPEAGRPAQFHGAIGHFELQSSASNSHVNVGDPIELELAIYGQEPMAGITDAPKLSQIPLFNEQFKASSDGWRETLPRLGGKRLYTTTIRALHADVDQIPSIHLVSFDPDTHSYQILKSQPIDIVVNAVQETTLSDAIITGQVSPSSPSKSNGHIELTRSMPGLWAHGSIEEQLAQLDQFRYNQTDIGQWFAIGATGPAFFALSCVWVRARNTNNLRAKELRIRWRRCRKLNRNGKHHDALAQYISVVLQIDIDAVTARDALKLGVDSETANAVESYMQSYEGDAFSGDHATSKSTGSDCSQMLDQIHRQVKQSGGWI